MRHRNGEFVHGEVKMSANDCGYVYVLSHPRDDFFPGVKIGYTNRTPRDRAREIRETHNAVAEMEQVTPPPIGRNTRLEEKFIVEFKYEVANPSELERKVHRVLADRIMFEPYRGMEWFAVTPEEARRTIVECDEKSWGELPSKREVHEIVATRMGEELEMRTYPDEVGQLYEEGGPFENSRTSGAQERTVEDRQEEGCALLIIGFVVCSLTTAGLF